MLTSRRKPNTTKLISLFLVLALLAAFFAVPALAVTSSLDGITQLQLLSEIFHILEEKSIYLPDGSSLNNITADALSRNGDLFWEILDRWTSGDPYSRFMPTREYDALFHGGEILYGIGIVFDPTMPLGVYVEDFLQGSGAESSSMEIGAQIVYVDGVNIADAPAEEARPLLLGERRTTVEVGFINPGSAEIIFEEIRRFTLTTPLVQGHIIPDTDIGYISIAAFGLRTNARVFDELFNHTLPSEGANSLIIDLRGNQGGQLDTTLDMLDVMFSERGVAILTQIEASGPSNFYSSGHTPAEGGETWKPERIIILVNDRTASAAEIFAGSLQALGKAEVVGEATFGKSHGQVHMPIRTIDAMLVLSTLRVDFPGRESFENTGIIPDHDISTRLVSGADLDLSELNTSRTLFSFSTMTERIIALQERLSVLGFYRAEPNGIFDGYTSWTLNRFQAAHELNLENFARSSTLQKLDEAAMSAYVFEDSPLGFAKSLLLN